MTNAGIGVDYGQSQVPPSLTNVAGVAAGGMHSLALLRDGSVIGWGAGATNSGAWPRVQARRCRRRARVRRWPLPPAISHSLALKSDGTVVQWGDVSLGQGSPPWNLSNVVAIAAGAFHNLALRSDGTVVAWGGNTYGETSVPTA